jgi:hypothetical protein
VSLRGATATPVRASGERVGNLAPAALGETQAGTPRPSLAIQLRVDHTSPRHRDKGYCERRRPARHRSQRETVHEESRVSDDGCATSSFGALRGSLLGDFLRSETRFRLLLGCRAWSIFSSTLFASHVHACNITLPYTSMPNAINVTFEAQCR